MMKRFNAKTQREKDAKEGDSSSRPGFFGPLRFLLLLVLIAGCVPAQEPDVLKASPGPGFVVTDRMYENSVFTARYPAGWRVQSGEAIQPPSVLFIAPDEVSYIQLQVGTLDTGNFSADRKTDVRGLTLSNGVQVSALLSAVPDQYDALRPVFEQVIASIQAI